MRGVLAIGMLLTLFLSGCAVEKPVANASAADDETPSGSSTGTSTASQTKSGTSTPGASTENQAPSALLNASATNGTAPLNVTFSLDGLDPDGDALTWTLTVGNTTLDEGTSLPANLTHIFEAGNHTVILTVSDGSLNASANVTLVVEAAAAEPEAPAAPTEDDWATFNPDGTCDAKGEISIGGTLYIHERGDPPGTAFIGGAGTWVYEEGNGIAGLQLGGPDDSDYAHCANPDVLIF